MSFTSSNFAVFIVVFLFIYHLASYGCRVRNIILIIGSYFFYGWWDWRFLGLIFVSSTVDFVAGIVMEDSRTKQQSNLTRWALGASMLINLGSLGFFKYCNFFIHNMETILRVIGTPTSISTLSIILPVGISFYTFQSLAYTIGVYNGSVKAERDPFAFYAYISFFPQLAAGPIERPAHFLPQFHVRIVPDARAIERAIWMIAWGYFLKMAIADSAAAYVDLVFSTDQFLGWSTVLGTLLFGLQIYGDFCGYSYMAKGIALLLGFDLMWNFDRPYWSTSIREFWRRWHISLSQWLRDFLYVPLGGNRHGELRTHANLMTTMLLGGLWHGAGWNFIAWGGLHGAALVVNRLWAKLGDRWQPRPALGWLMTMMVVMFGWFLFRATSRDLIVTMVRAFSDLRWVPFHTTMCIAMVALGTPLFLVEWMQRRTGDPCFPVHWPIPLRSVLTGALVVVVYALSERVRSEFIYFKF